MVTGHFCEQAERAAGEPGSGAQPGAAAASSAAADEDVAAAAAARRCSSAARSACAACARSGESTQPLRAALALTRRRMQTLPWKGLRRMSATAARASACHAAGARLQRLGQRGALARAAVAGMWRRTFHGRICMRQRVN